jgi:hypothetical protein
MKLLFNIAVLLCVFTGPATSLRAQLAVPPPMPAYQSLSDPQLDQLLGPIALYPDPLIAQILPASTLPTQIVLADRYVIGGGDPNQIDQQPWDPSVQALARYPNVLKWMDDNLNWTTQLGQAFLYQQQDVMNSIQRLRASAYNLGNLQSSPQQQVINDDGDIEIVPVDTQVIYVPVYQPDQVYYQTPYGSPFITFGIGWPIGIWLDCDFDWRNHNIIVWNHDHPRPSNWWHEPPGQRNTGSTTVWRPANVPGAAVANRGDRGWGAPSYQPVVSTVGRSVSTVGRSVSVTPSVAPRRTPAPAAAWPESDGAFIGIQSSHDTRTYSDRGQQSMETMPHSGPVSRPESVPRSGGGGGGGGSSNSHAKQ